MEDARRKHNEHQHGQQHPAEAATPLRRLGLLLPVLDGLLPESLLIEPFGIFRRRPAGAVFLFPGVHLAHPRQILPLQLLPLPGAGQTLLLAHAAVFIAAPALIGDLRLLVEGQRRRGVRLGRGRDVIRRVLRPGRLLRLRFAGLRLHGAVKQAFDVLNQRVNVPVERLFVRKILIGRHRKPPSGMVYPQMRKFCLYIVSYYTKKVNQTRKKVSMYASARPDAERRPAAPCSRTAGMIPDQRMGMRIFRSLVGYAEQAWK